MSDGEYDTTPAEKLIENFFADDAGSSILLLRNKEIEPITASKTKAEKYDERLRCSIR
jgi:hypothetical protein